LIEKIAETKKPVILSTGASNKSEIINKRNQCCSSIFLAPIFKVNKKNNFLGVNRFNYLTLNRYLL
jgi:hypothetical protein